LGWVAYTAYDSILDGEISTTYIPLANTCNIKMIRVLTDNELTNKIPHLREFMFRKLVELNTPNNEIAKQSMQGQKSIGHCIGPICIFSLVTKNWVHSDIFHLENYYANYLSLKQLSDDIHDWKEDIFADRKTYVTELILKQYNTSVKSQTISTEEIFCSYMETFTNSTIYIVHQEMMKQTESALYHLSMISQHFKPAYLKSKIKDTEKYVAGIKQAINEIELYNLYCYT
jgi:hypothetical protein